MKVEIQTEYTHMIPATATQAGKMDWEWNSPASLQPKLNRFNEILVAWQAGENYCHYVMQGFTFPADQVHGHFGIKYARLDIGGSGAFMVDIMSGDIYRIKGYGKVDLKKNLGNLYCPTFNAAVLVRDRFRHGNFKNNPDGSTNLAI